MEAKIMVYWVNTENGVSDFFYTGRRTNASCPPHVHSHIEFMFVLSGSLSLSVDDKPYILEQDTMAVIMPYQIHGYASNPECDMFVLACPPEYISEYNHIFNDKLFSPCIAKFSDIIQRVVQEITCADVQNPFRYKALIYHSLCEFVVSCDLVKRGFSGYDVYRKAIVYISEHYTEDLSLETVARYANVSPVHLSRVLNNHGKSSFSDIVNSIRIFEAKKLLEQTTRSISEIAYECGYGSIRNFNRIFQKYFSCNPRDVRTSRRQ